MFQWFVFLWQTLALLLLSVAWWCYHQAAHAVRPNGAVTASDEQNWDLTFRTYFKMWLRHSCLVKRWNWFLVTFCNSHCLVLKNTLRHIMCYAWIKLHCQVVCSLTIGVIKVVQYVDCLENSPLQSGNVTIIKQDPQGSRTRTVVSVTTVTPSVTHQTFWEIDFGGNVGGNNEI